MGKWVAFWCLGLIWGSSFLLIRIGVEELNQFQIVFIRTAIAAIGLNIILVMRGKRLPTDWKSLRSLIIVGVGNTTIPFLLITWGERSVESGLASVLQSTAALFSLVVAHFAFLDERITVQKVVGLAVGFIGVIILASRSWEGGQVITSDLTGQLAIVVASLFYAIFGTYSRKVCFALEPMVVSAGAMTTAAVISGVLAVAAPLVDGTTSTAVADVSQRVLFAVLMLGFVNTLIAYIIYYPLVQTLGAARTSMVTYIVPAVGLILGVIFLNELLDMRLVIGATLIFVAIGIVNIRLGQRVNPVVVVPPQQQQQ